ncbi:MAG TPA: CDP-diacylglycerol--serine O-phosphatidyltransferase [Polyangia bacterium]|nr:CDP-diacylglycerol--serine O-phosphatidyltransferase [Polyangia bacterium]
MNWRKTFFIVPNLFTLASVFCGFLSITLSASSDPHNPHDVNLLYQAALAICVGFFFDTFDGRIARLTRTQSVLGLQLDSLADVITFGAAPAMMVYKWGLTTFGLWGIFIAYTFCAAAAMRLARFNVLTLHETEKKAAPGKFILGLPVPAASAVLVSLVVVNYRVGGYQAIAQGAVAVVVLVLSYLMVSRIRFRSFKDLRLTKRSLAVIFLLVVASIAIYLELRATFIFVFLMASYVTLGLIEEVIFFRRRRAEERAAKEKRVLGPDDSEEDVLRELGAFDEDEHAGAAHRGDPDLHPKPQA